MKHKPTISDLLVELETARQRIVELEEKLSARDLPQNGMKQDQHNFAQILELLPVGISILDGNQDVVFQNSSLPKILGMDSEKLRTGGYKGRKYISPDNTPMGSDKLASAQAKQSGKPVYNIETGIVEEDGKTFWTNVSAMPVDLPDWKMVVVTTDITERKQAEMALQESNARFRTLFEASPDAVILIDPNNWTIFDCNTATCQMNGYTRDELIGQSIDILNAEPPRTTEHSDYLERVRSAGVLHYEAEHRHKNGTVFPIEVSTSLITLSGREMILGIDRDITERKDAEEKLRLVEGRYRALIENAPDGIVLVSEDGKFKYISPSAGKLFGYTQDEALDASPNDFTHPEDLPRVLAELMAVIENPAYTPILEYRFRHKNGEWRWIESTFSNLLSLPSVEAIIINFRDITKRKEVEEEARKANEKYRTIFDNAIEGIHQTTPDGHYLLANPATAYMLGYQSPEELTASVTNLNQQFYVDPQRRAEFKKIMEEYGVVSGFESEVYCKDGSTIWVSENVRAVHDQQGNLIYEGSSQDITERKWAEEAIYASEQQMQALVASLDDIVFEVDKDGTYLNLWTANEAMLFRPREQVIGKRFDEVFGKEASRPFFEYLKRTLESDTAQTLEYPLEDAGKQHWFTARYNPIHSPDETRKTVSILIRDITDRKQSELALKASEENYRSLVETSESAIAVLNRKGRILYSNPHGFKIWETKDIIGKTIFDVYPREYADRYLRVIESIIDTGITVQDEVESPIGDQMKWFRLSMAPLKNLDGTVTSLMLNAWDITEQKAAELEIRLTNERFNQIANNVSEIFWIVDPVTGKNLYVSPAFESIMGLPYEKLKQYPGGFDDFVLPEDLHILLNARADEKEGKKSLAQYRIRHVDGEIRWLRESGSPIRDAEGNVTGIVGVARDITEQVEAELRLKESEARFREIADNINEVFWMFDNREQKLIYMNPAYERIWGHSVDEVYQDSRLYIEAIHPDDRSIMLDALERQARGEHTKMEYRVIRPDGSMHWVFDHSSPVFAKNGDLLHTIGIATDITERKHAEKLLNRRMEDLSFLNSLNDAVNHGKSLIEITELIAAETKKIFGSLSASIYLLDKEKKHLVLQHYTTPQETVKNLEKVIGMSVPQIRIPVGGNDHFNKVLNSDEGMLINGLEDTRTWLADFTNTTFLSEMTRSLLRKVIPAASRFLKINSVISVPLKAGNTTLGVIELVTEGTFGSNILERFDNVRQQLSEVIFRRQVEQSLRESEENYRALAEASDAVIVLLDAKGRFQYVNEKAAQTQGLKVADAIGKTMHELLPQKIADLNLKRVKQVIDTGQGMVVEAPAGDRTYRNSIQPIHDEQGKPIMALMSATDITDLKRTTQALESRTQDLILLLEAGRALGETLDQKRIHDMVYDYISKIMPCGILIVSAFNPQTEMITCEYMQNEEGSHDVSGFPPIPLEPPGRGTQSLVIRSGESMLLPDYEAALKTARTNYYFDEDAQIVGKAENDTDEEHPRSAILVPLKMEGRVMGVLQVFSYQLNAYTEDHLRFVETLAFHVSAALSNAKLVANLEHRVQERTAEVRDLYDNAPTGYHSLDAEGNFVLINQTELNWLGYSREEMIGHTFADFITQKSVDAFRESFPLLKQRGWVRDLEFEIVRKDGSTFPALVSATAINDAQGNYIMSRSTVFDITERKKVEQALRDSEEQNRLLFEESPDAAVLMDATGNFLRLNRAYEDLTGLKREQLIGQTGEEFDLVAPETRQRILEAVIESQNKNEPYAVVEYAIKHASGQLRNVEARIFIMTIIGQARVLFTLRDITTRKQAELALRESRENLQYFFDTASDLIQSMDENGGYMYVNSAWSKVLGYTAEEASHMNMMDIVDPTMHDHCHAILRSLVLDQHPQQLEVVFLTKQGEKIIAEGNVSSRKDPAGHIATNGIFRNITDRKRAEDALRQSEETYRALFENANDGIFIFSLDNIIQRANPHGSEMLGYFAEELVGMAGNAFVAQENVVDADQRWQRLLAGEALPAYERKLLKKDGTWVESEISLSLIRDGDGTPRYIQSVVRDISTRKRAEETLRLANAELERALRMKDEFLANMSHELRTPLNAILGLSESMLEETAGPVNEKQKRYLVIVNESGRHLLALINDILDLAKIESGQVKLDMKNISVKEICETSLRMIKQLAQKKNQMVSLEIAADANVIHADERRLKQMIVNLLSNAVKFTPENKKLGLEVKVDKSLSSLLITVWDEGIGVAEQDLKRLFQPFVQLDSGLSRESGGTGLGLALVAEMARLHGGGIRTESKPGQGSRFTISLPWDESLSIDSIYKAKDTGRLTFPRAQVTENPETILLVEDTDHVVIMLKDFLEQSGYRVSTAQNGLEAIVQAKTLIPDLILMDVQMPGMDGLEATRRIRQQAGLGDIPIIALTALAMSSDRERCLAAGMNDYISKPVNLKNLLKTIQKYLPGAQNAKED